MEAVSKQHYRISTRWILVRLRALRAFSFPVSVLPVLVATAAIYPLEQWNWGIVGAMVFSVAFLHGAGNLFNDYFDFRSGVDNRIEDEARPGRFLVRGELTPKDVLIEAVTCLLLAIPAVCYLIVKCGPGLLVFGGLAVFGLYAYTGSPFMLKYKALGEPLIFLVFGPLLMLGAVYAQTGFTDWFILLLAVPVGSVTTAILVGNNIRDQEEDSSAGITTLTHVLGEKKMRLLYVSLVVFAPVMLAVLGGLNFGPRAMIAAPLLLILIRKPLISVWRGMRLSDIDVQTAQFQSALLIFLLIAMILNGGMK